METIQLQRPYTQTLATVDGSSFTHLLDDYESFCLESITTASTAMESPAALAQTTQSKDLAEVGEVVPLMLNVDDMMDLLDDDDSFCPRSIPLPPWMESPAAPAESGDLDLAEELEALVARLMEPLPLEAEPQLISMTDIFPAEDHTDVFILTVR
ncbi:hypothetical protein VZT92_021100 [Zoarces viviparus]|uniref:Uncharacterized protein n=1 Tax=Zoarces viviparus TaxID=48416 RepID=A0AAW1EFP9_ZOAVI